MKFLKPLAKSSRLLKLEALAPRLPKRHPKYLDIRDELARQSAGYKGEKAVSYFINDIQTPGTYALHNIRLRGGHNTYFQIDLLLATPSFLHIFETKNIARSIHFNDETRQIERGEQQFGHPFHQLKRQKYHLANWAAGAIPVEGKVVFASDSIHITGAHEWKNDYIYPYELPEVLNTLGQKYTKPSATKRAIESMLHRMIRTHQEAPYNPVNYYKMKHADIITGVRCPSCGSMSMIRKKKKWHCPSCNHLDSNAHIAALTDYAILLGPFITTSECARFLHIDHHIAYRLLINMNVTTTGTYKNKKYHLMPARN